MVKTLDTQFYFAILLIVVGLMRAISTNQLHEKHVNGSNTEDVFFTCKIKVSVFLTSRLRYGKIYVYP